MTDIELVIKIPEEKYNMIKNKMYCGIYDAEVYNAIDNGKPLPKSHGRLIDEKDLSLMTVHMIDGMLVCDALTIIEADGGE